MLNKTLLITLLVTVGLQAKAQFMRYEPTPVVPQRPTYNSPPPTTTNAQTIDAYSISPQNKAITKVKLKIVETQYSILIAGYKKLTDQSWTELTLPLQATQVYSGSDMSKYFEHEVYIAALGTKIYF